jgi:hypothetical protein
MAQIIQLNSLNNKGITFVNAEQIESFVALEPSEGQEAAFEEAYGSKGAKSAIYFAGGSMMVVKESPEQIAALI